MKSFAQHLKDIKKLFSFFPYWQHIIPPPYMIYGIVLPIYLSIIKLKYDKKIVGQWNYYIIIAMSLCLIYQVVLRYQDFMYRGIMSFIIFTILSICYLIFIVKNREKWYKKPNNENKTLIMNYKIITIIILLTLIGHYYITRYAFYTPQK